MGKPIHGNSIRAFIAASPGKECRHFLLEQQRALSNLSQSQNIRWTPTENFHITVKFLGKLKLADLDNLTDCLKRSCDKFHPFNVIVNSACNFPNSRSGKLIVCPISTNPILEQLAEDISNQVEPLGFAKETRRFRGHITLARRKFTKTSEAIPSSEKNCSMQIASLVIMQSKQTDKGTLYEAVREIPFASG